MKVVCYDGKMFNDVCEVVFKVFCIDFYICILFCFFKCGFFGFNLMVVICVIIVELFWNLFVEE